ncbi:hypothetical protein ACJ73_00314 [Blastomyces percursus]|uniref:Uncharacterized protein n=1 Tax=Blastomyces percursus TaxID=1658174 RepID=A0A1J9RJZ6_9EURO|nr:hypothetical protein ACJ73_00314 [Blastomyces percursus]
MVFKRHTTPLHFETLSALPSELLSEFTDSDDGLDDAAQAAKRRKIEKLGQDYLEGRPLFILSAGLRGPLDNGWVNPWKRNKGKDKKTQRGASLWKQDRQHDFRNGISNSGMVSSEAASKPLKRRVKPSHQVLRQGSGFESSLDPEPVQEQLSDQLQKKSGSRRRGQLETDIFSARETSSNSIFSKPRAVSARVNSTTAEQAFRSVSASTSYRFSVDSNNSWLKTDEKRLHPQAYERPTGSSPTPGYRLRSPRKLQQDGRLQHDNKRQRDDLIGDNNNNYTPRISFTPINGQGTLASSPHKTVRGPYPEGPQPFRKNSKSPGGHSHFSKPGKPASAFTGIPGRNEKQVVHVKRSYKSSTFAQPSGSLQVVPSTHHFVESEYPHPDKSASSADTISNSNGSVEHSKRHRSQGSRYEAQPESKDENPNNNNNSSHSLPLDPTPNGMHGLQDNLRTLSNMIASEALPFAQIVPDRFKFPIPTMSLHSTYFSAGYPSSARRSQNGGYEEQVPTLATQAAEKSQTNHASKVVVTSEPARPSHLSDASISSRQTNNRGQDVITPFDFSTVKRIKPGRRSEAAAEAIVPPGKRKDDQKEGRIRARNSDILKDSSFPSCPRNQAQSLSLSPKSTSSRRHRENSYANGSTSIDSHKRTVLPPSSLLNHSSNAFSADIPVVQPGETQSHDKDSMILPFNLTASTNDTRQYQEGQGHAPGWDNFDLNQAIADAGTFLRSWDFEKVDLERINHSNSVKSLNSITNMGNKHSSNTKENSHGAGARSG